MQRLFGITTLLDLYVDLLYLFIYLFIHLFIYLIYFFSQKKLTLVQGKFLEVCFDDHGQIVGAKIVQCKLVFLCLL